MRRAAAAKAAPGGKNGSLGGEPLELEKLPPQDRCASELQLHSLRKSKIQALLKNAYAGVEIYGREWGYHFTEQDLSGISECEPRRCADRLYRVTLELGQSSRSEEEVLVLVNRMSRCWRGPEYNVVHNNSLDFADALCDALGVGKLPRTEAHAEERKGLQEVRCSLKQLGLPTFDSLLSFFGAAPAPAPTQPLQHFCRPCGDDVDVNVFIPPRYEGTTGTTLSRAPSMELEIAMSLAQERWAASPRAAPAVQKFHWRPSVGTWLIRRGAWRHGLYK
ncbi:unnamed protein product [Cladocopium goreaui]|uniref:Deubiquitinase DESI2 (Desumoylating isopeptidas e 2) (DeSI-2) (PPPDE peptidase domain-containing protein 1) (Palmitoyl protein thioesterase DESI2) (Protein FAM152A ) (S-depalmitoylase DESI2) n=1 Tax=Cladocopium goreaui TaxID=2562237 RepID=A0A9P1D9W5_9DINO|nr:unnamed protein product [Cladocopium goreaui]